MANALAPEPRSSHETALIGDDLYLFGGTSEKGAHHFSRNEIWTYNVREEMKWIRRFAQGKNIPPPCEGARCVVINGIMYSYGGKTKDKRHLGEVFGLDPKKMKWILVATPAHENKPWQRFYCCLWAIGGRIIMFGGASDDIPPYLLQWGAQRNGAVNNEIYEFGFEEGSEKGYWLDVELSGERPQPRGSSAIETIDENRGLLHGGYGVGIYFDDAFVIDLKEKQWICIDFLPKPYARYGHRICRLTKKGFEERNCFLLIGGCNSSKFSDHAYILDFDKRKSYVFHLNQEIPPIWLHTLHCVENPDGSAQIIVAGGQDWNGKLKEPIIEFSLGPSNESFTQPETQVAATSPVPKSELQRIQELERELEEMRMEVTEVRDEKTQWATQYRSLEAEAVRILEKKTALETFCASLEKDIGALRTRCSELEEEKKEIASVLEDQTKILAESQKHLNQFMTVLCISASQVRLTNDKLGSGAYADVNVGHWHGMRVAVKKFHALITTPRTIPTFQREVLTASRLHHPNIIRVCGAVMEDGIPFQIVSELLEGSVSEVIDAAHSSPCYLSHYEQLSIVVQTTSAIAYLHGLKPRPYVHADIRPTNVLVTRDMKVKVADLGAAHLVESSTSAGPLSPKYIAPERMPPASARSSLPSDVYSLGVSLIEIFTGVGPIPEDRNSQLTPMNNRRRLHMICSKMISGERERPTSADCLAVLTREMEELVESGALAIKRMAKGQFEGEGDSRRHNIVLSDTYHL